MILHCTFEELTALRHGASRVLEGMESGNVAAPPEAVAEIEALLDRLNGDLSVTTLAEAESLLRAVEAIYVDADERLDEEILRWQNPSAEESVVAYFDYAYILAVRDRLRRMCAQMRAMIEVMTGRPPTEETARSVTFPD